MDNNAILAKSVSRKYGSLLALDKVSLSAEKGKVTALLGPNGAGKTTLIKTMTTLLVPDKGEIFVDGIDVLKNPDKVRSHFGLAGQFAAIDEYLTGRESLEMVGRLYDLSIKEAKNRAKEVLEKLGLTSAANRQAKTYSGGMRRRLDLGASLVAYPKVLFLDEPTTGLDPRTRFQLWDIIRDLVKSGTTILLTTQYLDEADALADKIYVIDKGKMIAEGTSEQLKKSLGKDVVEVKLQTNQISKAKNLISGQFKSRVEVDELTRRMRIRTVKGGDDLLKVANILKDARIKPEEIGLHRPTLDDVFLAITDEKAGKK
ncbi:ATP-binding cassette domain-containing protein [Candidatus Saccharibacteria bacterium CPR2]|nr:ATP-binding cassette domain-containing protein [Candidatus Saccharibacteria bacterium CPR2]